VTTGPNWGRVKQVFQEALDLPAQERLPHARAQCEHDPALLAEVESLLAAHQDAGSFAERPGEELLNALPSEPGVPAADDRAPLLTEGARLGAYEIQSLVGAGGMGEVYRARDTRLDRSVAIKVLRVPVGHDRTRERFEREARAVAALNHPHICTLHDVGHEDGIDFLVMEHLTGETLAARLSRGPLPVNHAVDMAIQIASALDSAHRAGIVHRDLKPGNIFLTHDGGPANPSIAKLLDFGLAKARPLVAAATASDRSSPLTTPGMLVGTVRYMAPEQLEGKAADARTDIFAFGAVIYEAIAGRRAFDGASDAHVMAAILEHDPPALAGLQPLTPSSLERVITTSLAKNADDRWHTARDLLHALALVRDGDAVARPAREFTVPRALRRLRPWAVAAGIAVTAAASVAIDSSRSNAPALTTISFPIQPPAGTRFPLGGAGMAVSPEGNRLAFVAAGGGRSQIWVRRFDSIEPRAISGTENATYPFWSPDGRSIGFFADGKVKRIAEAGGDAQVLCEMPAFAGIAGGGAWSRDGIIIFSALDGPIRGVPDTGGVAAPVTTIDVHRKERSHGWPVFLPDGRRFLYVARSTDRGQTGIYQGSLDSAQTRFVLAAESRPALLGPYLLVLSNGALVAYVFDADQARISGEPIVVAKRVESDSPLRSGGAYTTVNTALAYRSASPNSRLVWFDRAGKQLGTVGEPGDYTHPSLSSDDKRVAIERTDTTTGRHAIWILDLVRGTTSRLAFDATGAHDPVWSPDGSRVAFSSNRLGLLDLYSIGADGADGDGVLLTSSAAWGHSATDWSPDGRLLLYDHRRPGQTDLWIQPASPGSKGESFVATPANESRAQFSPDMRWIAYTSDESGVSEVYVRRFPGADGKWQVSTHGGLEPRWRRDGKELFYRARDGTLMAADVPADHSRFESGTPRALFNPGTSAPVNYVATRDGQRFLLIIGGDAEDSAPITVVLNWKAPLEN
jgi:serine/threonine protein kinase